MKLRRFCILLLALTLLLSGCSLENLVIALAGQLQYSPEEDGEFTYGCRGWGHDAFVSGCQGVGADKTITIPETFGEYKVTGLGGVIGSGSPAPFQIELPDLGMERYHTFSSILRALIPEDSQIDYYDFQLHIGANITSIDAVETIVINWPMGQNYGTPIVQVARVYVTCDEANTHFQSRDGRLYDMDGNLVEGFLYHDQTV